MCIYGLNLQLEKISANGQSFSIHLHFNHGHTHTHTHTNTMDENTSQGLKRSNDEIGTEDFVSNMESTTTDSIASKRSKVDSVEIGHATEGDMDTTGQGTNERRNARACVVYSVVDTQSDLYVVPIELAKDPKDPTTGLTALQASALERAKLFAKELQEEVRYDLRHCALPKFWATTVT